MSEKEKLFANCQQLQPNLTHFNDFIPRDLRALVFSLSVFGHRPIAISDKEEEKPKIKNAYSLRSHFSSLLRGGGCASKCERSSADRISKLCLIRSRSDEELFLINAADGIRESSSEIKRNKKPKLIFI